MSNFLIALLSAVSIGVWIFTKLDRSTGSGNSRNAAIGAAFSSFMIFVFVLLVLNLITSWMQ